MGEYFADILVEDELVVELKCVERLANEHTAQCLNYLRASGRTLCLLVNFQKPKAEWKRIIHGLPITGTRDRQPPSYTPSSRVSASPKRSSFTPIRSMSDRYRLHSLRLSSPPSM